MSFLRSLFLFLVCFNTQLVLGINEKQNNFYLVKIDTEQLSNAELKILDSCLNLYHGSNSVEGLEAIYNAIELIQNPIVYDSYNDLLLDKLSKKIETENDSAVIEKLLELKAGAFHNIAFYASFYGDMDKAIHYCFESLKVLRVIGNKQLMAASYITLGTIVSDTGNSALAIEYYEKAIDVQKDDPDLEYYAYALINIVSIYQSQGLLDLALQKQNEALSVFKTINDSSGIGFCLQNIGFLQGKLNNLEEGKTKIYAAIDIQTRINDIENIGVSYHNLAFILNKEKKYDLAIENLEKAIAASSKIGEVLGEANSKGLLGNIYLKKGSLKKAETLFNEVLKLHKDINNKEGICRAKVDLAEIQLLQGNRQMAKKLGKEALQIAKSVGFPDDIEASAHVLRKIFFEEKDYKNAFKYLSLEKEMSDSIFNAEARLTIQKNQLENNFKSKRQELENEKNIKEKENRLLNAINNQEKQKANQRLLMIGLLIIIILMAGIMYLLKTRRDKIRKEKVKLESEKIISDLNQKALQNQINTHFIFNALDISRGLMKKKEYDLAERHLLEIAKLIRMTLENASDNLVSIEDEIECLKAYLNVCKMIYGERLSFEIQVDNDISAHKLGIPPLLIQPFIENAVIHGVANSKEAESILVRFENRHDGNINCLVQNSFSEQIKTETFNFKRKSMGMNITEQRLMNVNQTENLSSTISKTSDNGLTKVRFDIMVNPLY